MEFTKINTRISFGNIEFAKISTRKKQSKHHSQKFVPAKICTNKVSFWVSSQFLKNYFTLVTTLNLLEKFLKGFLNYRIRSKFIIKFV